MGWIAFFSIAGADAESLATAKSDFAKSDRQLNEIYQQAKVELPEWRFAELQEDQREWVKYRDERAKQAALYDGQAEEGNEEANPEFWNAMAYLSDTRVRIIRAWLLIDEFPREWEGVWIDGFGGELILSEAGGEGLDFFLSVVRGPTYHQGFIAGNAEVNGAMARFTDKGERPDDETWLTFRRENGRLEVIGENTGYHHGARAYFDGSYIRLRQLNAEDLKRLKEEGGY